MGSVDVNGYRGVSMTAACIFSLTRLRDMMAIETDLNAVERYAADHCYGEIALLWPNDCLLRLCTVDESMYSKKDLKDFANRLNVSKLVVFGTIGRVADMGMSRLTAFLCHGGVFVHDVYSDCFVKLSDTFRSFARLGLIRFNERDGNVLGIAAESRSVNATPANNVCRSTEGRGAVDPLDDIYACGGGVCVCRSVCKYDDAVRGTRRRLMRRDRDAM